MIRRQAKDLKAQLVLAAVDCSGGDPNNTFTFEELLVKAWERDSISWGLRGFEREHPDSERIHRELDSRGKAGKGVVQLGLLEKVQARVYRLTPKGLASASDLAPSNEEAREKAGRYLAREIRNILAHPSFREWQADPARPKHFRNAGHFWGIAPGTPPRMILERIGRIDNTLEAALELLDRQGVDEVGDPRGGVLFDRTDIERSREFQETLKSRFDNDLRTLGAAVDV